MKFDRRSPRSWATLGAAGLVSLAAAVLAHLLDLLHVPRRGHRPRLVLHSHLFAGNVRALADHAPAELLARWDVRFLHLDPLRYRDAARSPVPLLLARRLRDMLWVARSDVFLCTHGLGVLESFARLRPRLAIVDVWHGIGYKPLEEYVEKTRRFDRLLVPSPWLADRYRELGVTDARMRVTGHGVWDPLLTDRDQAELCRRYGVAGTYRARVLLAPTWSHGSLWRQRDVFGGAWDEVLDELDAWAVERDVLLIFRSHLNAGTGVERGYRRVVNRPYADFPLTYDLLALTDVLVTDWSSIATDFLPARRPTIYLDTPPPFEALALEDADRVGPRVATVAELIAALEEAVEDPEGQRERYAAALAVLEKKVCGDLADGRVTARYLLELEPFARGR